MGKFVNHERASDFTNSIEDPIVQSLVRYAYQTLCMSDAVVEGESQSTYSTSPELWRSSCETVKGWPDL